MIIAIDYDMTIADQSGKPFRAAINKHPET